MSNQDMIKSKLKSQFGIDLLFILSALLFSVAIWWPTQYFPFHWDGAGFFNNAILELQKTNFSPLIATGSDFAHPPILAGIYALAFNIFGRSLRLAHILMFPFLPIMMVSTFYVGKKISGNLVGIVSGFLVALTPVILAEYGTIYIDLPASALAISAYAFWLYQKKIASMIILSLAALIKFTTILIIPLFILEIYFNTRNRTKDSARFKPFLLLLIPVVSVLIWLLYHQVSTGWFLITPGRRHLTPNSFGQWTQSASFILKSIFFAQGRWFLTVTSFLLLGYSLITRSKQTFAGLSHHLISIGITLAIAITFYVISGEFAQRYGIGLYALVYLLLLSLDKFIFEKIIPQRADLAIVILGVITVFSFINYWHSDASPTQVYSYRPDVNLDYKNFIKIQRQASLYIQTLHPKAKVYGGFPENVYMTQPHQGYIAKGLDFSLCQEYMPNENEQQLIIIHPYSPAQQYCRQLLDQVPLAPITRFQEGSKWIEIYQVSEGTESAQLNQPTRATE